MLWVLSLILLFFFFFNDTATTEIYTLSLHDALPICRRCAYSSCSWITCCLMLADRSEEHTSELQSRSDLVCRLLLEKKNKTTISLGSEGRNGYAHQQERAKIVF